MDPASIEALINANAELNERLANVRLEVEAEAREYKGKLEVEFSAMQAEREATRQQNQFLSEQLAAVMARLDSVQRCIISMHSTSSSLLTALFSAGLRFRCLKLLVPAAVTLVSSITLQQRTLVLVLVQVQTHLLRLHQHPSQLPQNRAHLLVTVPPNPTLLLLASPRIHLAHL